MVKVKELTGYDKLEVPRIVRASESKVLHIQVAYGTDNGDYRKRRCEVTRCNRVLAHGWAERSTKSVWNEPYTECARCGTHEDFEKVRQDWREEDERWDRKRDLERAQEQAEWTWNALGRTLNEQIDAELEAVVESGKILVPFTRDEISGLKGLLKHLSRVAGTGTKLWNRALNYVDYLETYDA